MLRHINPLYFFCLTLFTFPCVSYAQWVDFTHATDEWLSLDADGEEKDIVAADVNKDGWEDIIVVRRAEFSVAGGETDLLLLNTGTSLEDRTADFAPEFLTNPTDSRDVFVGDLDNDDWPDIVIANTFADQPVFYHNLGRDSLGNWLGFVDESAERFPLPLNVSPLQFCAVWAGDVNGDGAPDIYFNNYGINAGAGGAEDVLLMNDGTGHFVDESAERLGILRNSAFGTSVEMHDMDNDGDLDILKISTLFAYPPWNDNGLFLLFNDGTGHFSNWQKVPSQAPYMFSVADVNHDGLLDIYVVDDNQDYLNMGFEIEPDENITYLGQLVNDPRIMFFGGNTKFGDLDNDGFLDLGVADVDVDIPPCESGGSLRKFTMMQNNGQGLSAPYGNSSNLWNESAYDFAFIDLDNDCNLDVFLGRCGSYEVFMNDGNRDMGSIAIAGEPVFCQNDLNVLDAGEGFDAYLWSDNSTASTLSVDTSGMYCVTVTDAAGCSRVDCIEVETVSTFEMTYDATICNGESYELSGQSFDQTGNYQIELISAGGCDSTLLLNLNVLENFTTDLAETICEGESYLIGLTAYEASGAYSQTIAAANGCDSTINLELTVIPNVLSEEMIIATICQGEIYSVGDMNFVTGGSYQLAFPAANGCDSLVNLELTVSPADFTILTESICEGESYELGSEMHTTSGLYQATFDNQYGCDSLVQLNLLVYSGTQTELFYELCDGESVVIGDMTIDQPGIFEYILPDIHGCDSTIVLTVAALPSEQTTIAVSMCEGESYSVGTSVYTTSGEYVDILTTSQGCDSVITLDLTVWMSPFVNVTEFVCAGEFTQIGDEIFTETGIYEVVLISATTGCDSTVSLDLTVFPNSAISLTETICAGEAIQIGDMVFTETGMYEALLTSTETGCDSLVAIDLTVSSTMIVADTSIMADNGTGAGSISVMVSGGIAEYTYLWSNEETTAEITGLTAGDYTLTVTDAAQCSAVFTFFVDLNSATGSAAGSNAAIFAYPNPFSESVMIQLENEPVGEKVIELIDVNGRRIMARTFTSDQLELELDAPTGVYLFRVRQDGKFIGAGRLIKKK